MRVLIVGLLITLSTRSCLADDNMLLPVQEENRWGFIDTRGNVVIPIKFFSVNSFSDGLALVATGDDDGEPLQGFIDKLGTFVIGPGPPKNCQLRKTYWSYRDFYNGRAGYWVGDSTGMGGYIDKTGEVVIPVVYRRISDFSEGVACVGVLKNERDGDAPIKSGFIDVKGSFVIAPNRSFVAAGFANGICSFSIENERFERKSGYLNRNGEIVVAPTFDGAADCSDGLCRVSIRRAAGRRFGYLDTSGRIAIAIEFDVATNFVDGIAYVAKENQGMLINARAEIVAKLAYPPQRAKVSDFSEGLAVISVQDGRIERSGFIDSKAVVTVPIEYDYASSFRGGLALVTKGAETGYINREGKFVWKTKQWNLLYSPSIE